MLRCRMLNHRCLLPSFSHGRHCGLWRVHTHPHVLSHALIEGCMGVTTVSNFHRSILNSSLVGYIYKPCRLSLSAHGQAEIRRRRDQLDSPGISEGFCAGRFSFYRGVIWGFLQMMLDCDFRTKVSSYFRGTGFQVCVCVCLYIFSNSSSIEEV